MDWLWAFYWRQNNEHEKNGAVSEVSELLLPVATAINIFSTVLGDYGISMVDIDNSQ